MAVVLVIEAEGQNFNSLLAPFRSHRNVQILDLVPVGVYGVRRFQQSLSHGGEQAHLLSSVLESNLFPSQSIVSMMVEEKARDSMD